MKKILFTLILLLTVCLSHAQILYSTTGAGGDANAGTICKLDLATNTLTAAFSFNGINGRDPGGNLVQASNGKLYGMTTYGGSGGYGVIFSYDPATATYVKLKEFDGTNGAKSYGSLVQASNGKLYGMTYQGGNSNYGLIFSYDPLTATYADLHDFDSTNGANPYGSLVQASDGKLYGMTTYGGRGGYGVIFSYDPATATYTKLLDFGFSVDGGYPSGSLIQASNGKLYGMATAGGDGYGVIFSYDPATAVYAKLLDFDYTNGADPSGSLVQASNSKLYGMTYGGGDGNGVIFSYNLSTANYTKLKVFDYTSGANPYGSLVQASDGKLYGMTSGGGSGGYGVSFSFDPVARIYTKLADFTGSNGSSPYRTSFIERCTTTTWYRDADGDGFGDTNNAIAACSSKRLPGYVTNSSDCNDNKASVHPGATEICGNGIDDNCNGQVDEGCSSVLIAIKDKSIFEGNSGTKPMKFTVILNKNPVITTTVDYTTQNSTAKAGSDYIAQSGTLSFAPGVRTNVITILVVGDKVPELNETFKVLLSNAVNAGISDDKGIGTIENDDSTTALKPMAQNQDAGSAVLRDFTLSPNPASGKVNLIFTGYSGNLTIQLLDINGKILQEKKVISLAKLFRQQIDISSYPNGVYLVTVMDENGTRKTEKLIISR